MPSLLKGYCTPPVTQPQCLDVFDGRSHSVPAPDERRESVDLFSNQRVVDGTANPVAEQLDRDPFDRQRRRPESQRRNAMRPIVLIEDVRQQDLRHSRPRRRGRRARPSMMNGGRGPRKDQGMRHIVDSQHVVGLADVPVERCPAAGDDRSPSNSAHCGDGLRHQLGSTRSDHAAKADVNRRCSPLQERLGSCIQGSWFIEHPRVSADRAIRRVIRQRPQVSIGREYCPSLEDPAYRAVEQFKPQRGAAAVDVAPKREIGDRTTQLPQ